MFGFVRDDALVAVGLKRDDDDDAGSDGPLAKLPVEDKVDCERSLCEC